MIKSSSLTEERKIDSSVKKNNVAKLFVSVANTYADKEALLYKHVNRYHSISYNELSSRVSAFAAGLKRLGASKGDRLAIIHDNSPEWITCDLACLAIGVIDVPLYKSIGAEQLSYILGQCKPKFFFLTNHKAYRKIADSHSQLIKETIFIIAEKPADTDKEEPGVVYYNSLCRSGLEDVESGVFSLTNACHEIAEDDTATIIYTSGTTGNPKGVVISNGNIISEIDALFDAIETRENDIIISFLPLSHVLARLVDYFIIFSGRTVAYTEAMEALAKNLLEIKPTLLVGVPRVYDKLYSAICDAARKGYMHELLEWGLKIGDEWNNSAERKMNPSPVLRFKHMLADKFIYSRIRERLGGRVNAMISGGAPLRRDVALFFKKLGLVIQEGYGLTETCCAITLNRRDNIRIGTVGQPIKGVEVKIGADSEILIRGPMVMKGYYGSGGTVLPETDSDGWFHTGDAGSIDEEGFITIRDRMKELIKTSSGKYVAPQRIERMLAENSIVANAVVLGDSRKFITALIVPEKKFIEEKVKSIGAGVSEPEDVLNDETVIAVYKSVVSGVNSRLENHERIKNFRLLKNDFSVDGGELTPTLKLRRKIIYEKYESLINSMYEGF